MIFYVDSIDGNNTNNGLSMSTPFKDLTPFKYSSTSPNSSVLRGGDSILIKCNSKIYGYNKLYFYGDKDIVYLGCYGGGDLPILSMSKIVDENNYIKQSENVYYIDLSDSQLYSGTISDDFNVGNIYFSDKNTISFSRKNSLSDLTENFDFYVDTTGKCYIYYPQSPYLYSKTIHFNIADNYSIFQTTNNLIIENIQFDGCGVHGINTSASDGYNNINIKNCVFKNLGGSYQSDGQTRYGNGFECYNKGNNITVNSCYFENIYDVAVTAQGTTSDISNINFINNYIYHCTQGFEIWSEGTIGLFNIYFNNNTCYECGYINDKPGNRNNACAIIIRPINTPYGNININNNLIYNPVTSAYYGDVNKVSYRSNTIFDEITKKINYNYEYTIGQIEEYINTLHNSYNDRVIPYTSLYSNKFKENILYQSNFNRVKNEFTIKRNEDITKFNPKIVGVTTGNTVLYSAVSRLGNFVFMDISLTVSNEIPANTTIFQVIGIKFIKPIVTPYPENNLRVYYNSSTNTVYIQSTSAIPAGNFKAKFYYPVDSEFRI